MKVQTIQRRINRSALRLLAICSAVLMGVASSGASAQSPLLNYLSNPASDQAAGANPGVRQVSLEGQGYRVIKADNVKTVGDLRGPIGAAIAGQQPVKQTRHVRQTSCNSCNSGACNGGCQSYSAYGMDDYGGNMTCGPPCKPYCYGVVEGVYLRREGDRRVFYGGGAFARRDFDFEFAPRVTIGSLPDCVHGCEATFVGVLQWDRIQREVATDDFLPPIFSAGDGLVELDPDEVTPFTDNVIARTQVTEAEYWSIEGNKTLVGWDVAKILYGFRYLQYEEEFRLASTNRLNTNPDPDTPPVLVDTTGQISSDVRNRLAGLQIGLDLLYPVGRFAYADFRSRAGLFLNFAEGTVALSKREGNAPVIDPIFANYDEVTDLAGVIEVGGGLRYQLGDILAVRVGTELLYIPGVGKAPAQIPGVLSPRIGQSVSTDQEVFFWGLSLGGEIRL